MKTVNTIFKAIVLIAFLSLASCNDDEDQGGNSAKSNTFKIEEASGSQEFATPNVYLIIDGSETSYDNDIQFVFTDRTMREDATHGVSMDVNTEHFVFLSNDGVGTATSMAAVTDQLTVGSHTIDDDTVAAYEITDWDGTYTYNSMSFGFPAGYTSYELEASFGGSLDIESISIDLVARTGTINCTYTFYSYSTGVPVRGEYQGAFEILNSL